MDCTAPGLAESKALMEERRQRGADRREAARGEPDRRRGRRPLSDGERQNRQTLHVQLTNDDYDVVSLIALRRGISNHAAARLLIALSIKTHAELLLSK